MASQRTPTRLGRSRPEPRRPARRAALPERPAAGVLEGVAAGVAASVVQVAVGKTEEWLFLPRGEDSDIAPRLVDRTAQRLHGRAPPPVKWALGTAFHLGYGAFWGAVYGGLQRVRPLPPMLAGTGLGLLIYAITFPGWGAAVRIGAERPPDVRSRRMTIVAASVALTYGLTVAAFFRRLARH